MNAMEPGLARFALGCTAALCACGRVGAERVHPANQAPVAAITAPATAVIVAVGGSVTFTGTCSDGDGDTIAGSWSIPGSDHATAGGLGPVVATFEVAGTHQAILTCTDGAGMTGSASRSVDVRASMADFALWAAAPPYARAGSAWGSAVLARVVDASGNAVAQAGIPITVAVQGVSGGLSGATTTTTSDDGWAVFPGVAFTSAAQGVQTLTFTSSGLASATATLEVRPSGSFNITLRFLGTATMEQRAAFDQARMRWESVISGDLTDVPVSNLDTTASCQSQTLNETIDDVLIFAKVVAIDGPGGILAQAGPCFARSSNHLPIIGQMMFDSADLDVLGGSGTLRSVVLHEMGHVLGFGTVWPDLGLLGNDQQPDPYFSGVQARTAFGSQKDGSFYAGTPVPVEATGGAGTAYSHWREMVFGRELMTGWLSGNDQPLSATTIGSLADIGYVTDPTAADAFDIASASLRSSDEGAGIDLGDDVLGGPVLQLDDAGQVTGAVH